MKSIQNSEFKPFLSTPEHRMVYFGVTQFKNVYYKHVHN